MSNIFSADFAGRNISLKTNYVAGQADGSVLVYYGDTVVLVTAVSLKGARAGIDFLPLTVDYQEMTFAAGKIPGGFFKREGRLNEREILISRIIDRSIRPLFPKGYYSETQLVATVLSVDKENDSDIAAWWEHRQLWKCPIFRLRDRLPACASAELTVSLSAMPAPRKCSKAN